MVMIPFDVNDAKVRETFLHYGLPNGLATLQENAQPRWGKMAAQQMVEHLAWAFELSTGRAQTTCSIPEAQRDRLKAFLYDNRPTPREFMNPVLTAGLPSLRHENLDVAKAALREEIEHFLEQSVSAPGAYHMHPLFGPMGAEEWTRVHFKHAYHHLLQFALIDED
jgi:oxepin-CoA hydrolase / 3-oxo-5,6-dehydrosuberyl-CoA semialdehyde dehydrogenase